MVGGRGVFMGTVSVRLVLSVRDCQPLIDVRIALNHLIIKSNGALVF